MVGFFGVHELYAVRDAIFIHCASPARRFLPSSDLDERFISR